MFRKRLRQLLPDHAAIRGNRWVARFGARLQHHNLWHLHRRSVAGGIAVGLFAGLIPGSNPVQFTAGALLAIWLRVNLPLAVLVTLYSNPFTIVPLYLAAYELGQLVLGESGGGLPAFDVSGDSAGAWLRAALDWLITVGKPLLAVMLAAAGYLLVRVAWRCHAVLMWRRRARPRRVPSA